MANMPFLYQNIMDGLPCDFSRDVFLWASDKTKNDPQLYKAEKFAREASGLFSSESMLGRAFNIACNQADLDDDVKSDLLEFIKKRHANYRLGGNLKTIW